MYHFAVILLPLIKYDTSKKQVLSFGGGSNIHLNNLNGLNEAIENAVNLILEYEQDMDKKQNNQQKQQSNEMMNYNNQMSYNNNQMNHNENQMNHNDNQMNYDNQMNNINNQMSSPKDQYDNGEQMNNQDNDQQNEKYYQKYNQGSFIQIPSSRPLYEQNQEDKENYEKNNQNDLNAMIKAKYLSINNYNYDRPKLERNQKYVKKFFCKTRKHKKELRSRQFPSDSNNYANFLFENNHNMFYYPRNQRPYSQINRYPKTIRYPVYVTDYDTNLIHRQYTYGNIFIK